MEVFFNECVSIDLLLTICENLSLEYHYKPILKSICVFYLYKMPCFYFKPENLFSPGKRMAVMAIIIFQKQ